MLEAVAAGGMDFVALLVLGGGAQGGGMGSGHFNAARLAALATSA